MPADFICPITQELMCDPVNTVDGNAYERAAIAAWFASGKITSPLSNALLNSRQLTPNLTLRRAIETFVSKNPMVAEVGKSVKDLKVCLALREQDMLSLKQETSCMVDRQEHERVVLQLQRTQRELEDTRAALKQAQLALAASSPAPPLFMPPLPLQQAPSCVPYGEATIFTSMCWVDY